MDINPNIKSISMDAFNAYVSKYDVPKHVKSVGTRWVLSTVLSGDLFIPYALLEICEDANEALVMNQVINPSKDEERDFPDFVFYKHTVWLSASWEEWQVELFLPVKKIKQAVVSLAEKGFLIGEDGHIRVSSDKNIPARNVVFLRVDWEKFLPAVSKAANPPEMEQVVSKDESG